MGRIRLSRDHEEIPHPAAGIPFGNHGWLWVCRVRSVARTYSCPPINISGIVEPGFTPGEYDKYGCRDRSSWFSPAPILLHRVLALDAAPHILTGVFCGCLPANSPGWYVPQTSLVHGV